MVVALGWVLIVLGVAALTFAMVWPIWLILFKGVRSFQIRGMGVLLWPGIGLLVAGLALTGR